MSRIRKRKLTGNSVVDELMARFEYAFQAALPHFERMERIQKSYDNEINSLAWPTISQISAPLTFMSVEEQLPYAMKYLFPKNRYINLIPSEPMDRNRVKNIEDNLRYTLRSEMDIESACIPSIRDCYKFAVGYGMVTTEYITPPKVMLVKARSGNEVVASTREITISGEKQVTIYKYLSPIQVIPMPDGANVEGPNRASGHFVVDFKTESEFRDMYKQKGMDDKPLIKGDADKIIAEARANSYDYRFMPIDIIANIAGIDFTRVNNGDKRMPVLIPIIMSYEDHRHVWIANGTTEIYKSENTYQSMRSDLIKWSAWPDGLRWYPLGVTEASEKLALGVNIWYNGLVDLAMYHINPIRVLNTRIIDNPNDVSRSPRSDIKVSGDAAQAIKYLELPQFPGQLFTMGDILQRLHANSNAIIQGSQDRSPGLVRGGNNALETLISSSTGRQFLAAMILKTGGLKPLVEKVLLKKQLIMDETGESFVEQAYNPRTGELFYEEKTVTLDDIRNIFRVELDMPIARLNSQAALNERITLFDRAQQHPELFDQRSLFEELVEDDSIIRRVMLPEEIVAERQEAMAQARLQAAQNNAAQGIAENIAPTQTPIEQGPIGAVEGGAA